MVFYFLGEILDDSELTEYQCLKKKFKRYKQTK